MNPRDSHSIHCPTCGIEFALYMQYIDQRVKDSRTFWCPNGHSMRFKPNAAAPQSDLHRQVQSLQMQLTHANDELEAAQAALRNGGGNDVPPEPVIPPEAP